MICIYHSKDLDGYTSGAIVKRKYPNAKLVGYDYGEELVIKEENEPIIMVDVSLPMEDMLKLSEQSNGQLTWIDHHASAIKDFNEFMIDREPFCTAVLKDGEAACEGAWKYLFPDEEIPNSVLLLGEYDTWRNSDTRRWDKFILPFQYGMRVICNSPETFPAYLLEQNANVSTIIQNGNIILDYQEMVNETLCKRTSFECDFEGFRAICLNGGNLSSRTFNSVYDENKHDLMMAFQYNGNIWTVTIYTTKQEVDCSVLAKQKGGGGHRQAAGFQIKDIKTILK